MGLGAKPELLQAKVDLNAQTAAQLTQETLIAQLKEQLNQLMGVKISSSYEVADSIPINTGLQIVNLRGGIEATNPTLLLAKKILILQSFHGRKQGLIFFLCFI